VSETVAVATLTALATLAAGALTGAASMWLTRRQLAHQQSLFEADRDERRAARILEARLAAYEHLLARVDAAYRVLDEGWLTSPPPRGRWEAGFAARRGVDEAFVRVRLTGPDEVVDRARDIVRGLGAEFAAHRDLLAAHPSAAGPAAGLDPAARPAALRAREELTGAFVAAARAATFG
jgi:hypothetical protein